MYSSLDNPSHEDWVKESNKLLDKLKNHLNYYTQKIKENQEEGNDFMIKFYCLKLLDANKRLKMATLAPSFEEEII
jgi:hypothetical protein